MKQIQPVMVWSNGREVQANGLNSYVVSDNLSTQAIFYYGVGDIVYNLFPALPSVNVLSSGYLTMTGKDYTDWQTNQYAWDWVASQLNLTIVGDITTTTTTTEAPKTTTTTLI
jgi:hypothetical protein